MYTNLCLMLLASWQLSNHWKAFPGYSLWTPSTDIKYCHFRLGTSCTLPLHTEIIEIIMGCAVNIFKQKNMTMLFRGVLCLQIIICSVNDIRGRFGGNLRKDYHTTPRILIYKVISLVQTRINPGNKKMYAHMPVANDKM